MEHTESQNVERYLLDELNEQEAEAFEEHYFDCLTCTEDLRIGMALLEGGRQLVREEQQPKVAPVVSIDEHRPRRVPAWAAAVAASFITVLAGVPFLIRTPAPAFAIGTSADLAGMRSPGDDAHTILVKDGQPVVFLTEIPPEPPYAQYEIRVLDSRGTALTSLPVSPEQAKNLVPVVCRELGAGTYQLTIVGIEPAGQRAEIDSKRFIVKRQGSTS